MRDADRIDAHLAQPVPAAWFKHDEAKFTPQPDEFGAGVGEHRAEQPPGPFLEMFGSGNRNDLAWRGFPQIVEKQKWQTAEMIAVQMAYKDEVDVIGLDIGPFERRQDGRPGFHQDLEVARFYDVARLKTSAACERVTGTEKADVNRGGR